MFNVKNIVSFAAIICGLLICCAAPEKAAAQNTPPGSYKKSCFESKVFNRTTLVSKCVTKNEKMVDAKLYDFDQCSGDISNENGTLTCSKVVKVNTSGAPPAQAAPDASQRAANISKAFFDVYGWDSGPKEQGFYDSQIKGKSNGEGYQTVFQAEKTKLNADPIIRRLMILGAYKKTMGRPASKNEYDYWTPKTEVFRALVDATRLYLYAPQGATDLTETVKRALKDKTGNVPTSDEAKKAMIQYSQGKKIYDEM